jgi:hypothetical protein
MDTIWWALSTLVLGVALGYGIAVVQQQFASDNQAARRAARRRLVGLEDRPAPQPGAIGHARIRTANVKREVRGL